MSEKLQKVLARKGIGSRRGIESLIAQGRVAVDGVQAKVGDRIEDEVTVTIDGKVVLRPGEGVVSCRVLMYHKKEGELTTLKDPEDRPTVFDHLPNPGKGRWIYIGRLDINTSGLLLFTTDGALANALMHPKHGIERVYATRVYGDVSEDKIASLQKEVQLEDGPAHFDKVQFKGGDGRNLWFDCTLKEGRKREVRRLWEAVGCKVSRLIRISYGGVQLDPKVRTGEYRDLTLREVNRLRAQASLEPLTLADYPFGDGKEELGFETASPKSQVYGKPRALNLKAKSSFGMKKNASSFAKRRENNERRFDDEVFSKDKRNSGRQKATGKFGDNKRGYGSSNPRRNSGRSSFGGGRNFRSPK